MDSLNGLIVFYVSLIAHFILHMIFVISSDFVEAFNIPPLNIGIYVDKLVAIRSLLVIIADIIESQCTLNDHSMNQPLKDVISNLKKGQGFRRVTSLVSFTVMLLCRVAFLIIVYTSYNKSLLVFIILCSEGFWFGLFKMSFFAIGSEYNAIIMLGIHTMGNFTFFLQVILNHYAKKNTSINCLYRVRVHAWIVVITSVIAICLWSWFCTVYSLGGNDSDQFQSLVCMLKDDINAEKTTVGSAKTIAEKFAGQMRSARVEQLQNALNKCKELNDKLKAQIVDIASPQEISKALGGTSQNDIVSKLFVKSEFGYEPTGGLDKDLKGSGNEIKVDIGSGIENSDPREVSVVITGSSEGGKNFTSLVNELSETSLGGDAKQVANYLTKTVRDAGSPRYKELVDELKRQLAKQSVEELSDLDEDKLKKALEEVTSQIASLVENDFKVTDVKNIISVSKVKETINVNIGNRGVSQSIRTAAIVYGNVKIQIKEAGSVSGLNIHATAIAERLAKACRDAANKIENANLIEALVKDLDISSQSVDAISESNGTNVTVKIGDGSEENKGEATVSVQKLGADGKPEGKAETITITVKGNSITAEQIQSIANALALAIIHENVKNAIEGYDLKVNESDKVTITVKNAKSKAQANRIAYKLGSSLCRITEVTKTLKNNESIKIQVSINQSSIDGDSKHVWSPFWLFIIGAFAEDFAVPDILPFAFLNPEKANLVNYLTSSFFMTGDIIILFLNNFFDVGGFAKNFGISHFKEWSEGAAPEWHSLWLLNIPKYIAFFIAMFSIHGIYGKLKSIIQSRWRVLLLTMFTIVPGATLEVAGYVGVANYAILASQTRDFTGFRYIAYHDMLVVLFRFVYSRLAAGYNLIRIKMGYCLPNFNLPNKSNGFYWWISKTLFYACADIYKDFKPDLKNYL